LPNLNPIKEFFAELKSFIKINWKTYEESVDGDFGEFLDWCVNVVGGKSSSAKGHFRHAGVTIEEL